MILVTGATGTTGSELVRQLNAAGAEFKIMVRNSQKARDLFGNDVSDDRIVEGDFTDPASLEAVLSGVERAYLCSTPTEDMEELHGSFVEAAKNAGTRHIVRLSVLVGALADTSLVKQHVATDKMLQDSGVAYTLLRPHFFMQNLLAHAHTIKTDGAFYEPMKDGKISLVDIRDIAAVALRALTEDRHEGKIYTLTGPDALSFNEIAALFSEALGREIKYVDVEPDATRAAMLDFGLPEYRADGILELYVIFADGKVTEVSRDTADVTGRPATSFAQFARDHAAVFGG